MGKRLSPFSREFWLNKGFSEDEAEYKRNSIRPIRKEYWIERGYSEEEAIELAIAKKTSNNLAGARKTASRPIEEKYKSSVRRKEYWIERGYSEEEAASKVKDIQSTGSLENFISRYGLVAGTAKWRDRQVRWQNTLNNKSLNDINAINKRKSSIRLDLFDNVDSAISTLSDIRNMTLFKTVVELAQHTLELSKTNPYLLYMPFEKYCKQYIPKIQFEIFRQLGENINELREIFVDVSQHKIVVGNKQAYRKWVSEGLLRSSYEIYFYDRFANLHPDVKIDIDRQYPNSRMRYDFKIDNVFIEICPMMSTNKKYAEKMLVKQKTFGCVLLKTIDEIELFLKGYPYASDCKADI